MVKEMTPPFLRHNEPEPEFDDYGLLPEDIPQRDTVALARAFERSKISAAREALGTHAGEPSDRDGRRYIESYPPVLPWTVWCLIVAAAAGAFLWWAS